MSQICSLLLLLPFVFLVGCNGKLPASEVPSTHEDASSPIALIVHDHHFAPDLSSSCTNLGRYYRGELEADDGWNCDTDDTIHLREMVETGIKLKDERPIFSFTYPAEMKIVKAGLGDGAEMHVSGYSNIIPLERSGKSAAWDDRTGSGFFTDGDLHTFEIPRVSKYDHYPYDTLFALFQITDGERKGLFQKVAWAVDHPGNSKIIPQYSPEGSGDSSLPASGRSDYVLGGPGMTFSYSSELFQDPEYMDSKIIFYLKGEPAVGAGTIRFTFSPPGYLPEYETWYSDFIGDLATSETLESVCKSKFWSDRATFVSLSCSTASDPIPHAEILIGDGDDERGYSLHKAAVFFTGKADVPGVFISIDPSDLPSIRNREDLKKMIARIDRGELTSPLLQEFDRIIASVSLPVILKNDPFSRIERALERGEELIPLSAPPYSPFRLPPDIHPSQLQEFYQLGGVSIAMARKASMNVPIGGLPATFPDSFSGILAADELTGEWWKVLSIVDAEDSGRNNPYALWTIPVKDSHRTRLLLTIVNTRGGGSGEGVMKLLESNDGREWKMFRCMNFGMNYRGPLEDGYYFLFSRVTAQFSDAAGINTNNPSCNDFTLHDNEVK